MKRFLLVALAAAALGTSSGCCRGWFIWPGHYPHNPAFSQCCEPPWGPRDTFERERGAKARPAWGRGSYEREEGECCYQSCGIGDWFGQDCGHGGQGAAHGYPPAAGGYPGMNYGGQNGAGMYGGPQPAPDAMSAAQVAYPYYTNRGPRDFLMGYPPGTRPPSIGP
jgi:hypothetical protein